MFIIDKAKNIKMSFKRHPIRKENLICTKFVEDHKSKITTGDARHLSSSTMLFDLLSLNSVTSALSIIFVSIRFYTSQK